MDSESSEFRFEVGGQVREYLRFNHYHWVRRWYVPSFLWSLLAAYGLAWNRVISRYVKMSAEEIASLPAVVHEYWKEKYGL